MARNEQDAGMNGESPKKLSAGQRFRLRFRRGRRLAARALISVRNAVASFRFLPEDPKHGAILAPRAIQRLAVVLSVSVAAITALAPPAAYFITGFLHATKSLVLETDLAARQIAHHIERHADEMRADNRPLANGFLAVYASQPRMRQRVYDTQGHLSASKGGDVPGPVHSRRAPVVADGLTIGSVETVASLRPLIAETISIGILGAMLGLLVYVAASRLPLRELNRTLCELQKRRRELATQNMRFNAALNNMTQGLCMFDAEHRLVVSNQKWADIYSLGPEQVKPGTTFREIVEDRIRQGVYSGEDPAQYVRERIAAVSEGVASTKIQELTDGRAIVISHQPMLDGGWVATHEDITEQRRVEARIAHLAHHDALTDLPNRALLRERIEEAFAQTRSGSKFALLWLDLDRFKSINDTLGHPVGDELLQAVATRLQTCVNRGDTVARPGGDEFAIVHAGYRSMSGASDLAERIIKTLRAPFDLSNHRVTIDTSIGIVIAPDHGSDADELLNNADVALYSAKKDGRGNYSFFQSEMKDHLKQRRAIEADLCDALVRGEFELYYQPLVSLRDNGISCFEALLRWDHPARGQVSPDEFIPVAEEVGLIVTLGEWVLRQACTEAAGWPDGIKVAVNLSPVQFRSGKLVETVVNTLAATGLQANRLELEITESVLLNDDNANMDTLHRLRQLGVRISMDDFGTGYSSLSYLRSFPFDKIKIDRSFIADVTKGDEAVAIVRAVTGLGRRLGIATVAEGVETQEQKEMVRALGCSEMQGYLCSEPLPVGEARALLPEPGPETELRARA